jgi:hypothetical protein
MTRQFTAEEIQAQFEKLPAEVQKAVTSASMHDAIVMIAKNHSLHIDQEGELVDLVGLIMLGLSPSKDFVRNFSGSTGVDTATASAIATEINKEIFDKIRSSMRAIEEDVGGIPDEKPKTLSDLERIGGFDMEQSTDSSVDQGSGNMESKQDILDSIENPTPANYTEPLIDHLLSGPVVTIEQKTQAIPKPVPQPPKPKGPDLYREPVI